MNQQAQVEQFSQDYQMTTNSKRHEPVEILNFTTLSKLKMNVVGHKLHQMHEQIDE